MSTAVFHQAALPPGWKIEDEATLPGGRTIAGTAARVYNLLAETARRNHRWKVGRHLAPAGWVPTWVLREPWAGGAAGDRRLRDLRAAGVSVDGQSFSPGDEEPGSASWLWHLGSGSSPASRPAHAASDLPLSGISVRLLSDGSTPPAGAIDVSPGAPSPLAPSFAACSDEAYRQELLAAWRSGRLTASLAGRSTCSLWADPLAPFDPRPVLQTALAKLGANVGEARLGA